MDRDADKTRLIRELKSFEKDVSKKVPIEKMIFFGSRATGKYKKESDIDLVVVSPKFKNMKFRERPLLLYDNWRLKYPVDFLCYTPEEFEKMKKRIGVVKQAVEEGIAV